MSESWTFALEIVALMAMGGGCLEDYPMPDGPCRRKSPSAFPPLSKPSEQELDVKMKEPFPFVGSDEPPQPDFHLPPKLLGGLLPLVVEVGHFDLQ